MLASYYQVLKELVAMKSVSVNADAKDDIEKIAIYLNTMLQDNAFSSEIIHGYGNPIVLGKYFVDKSLPTVLLYGHYDVQRVDMNQGWKYDPFSLYIGKDKVYGKGVAANKGQFLIYLLTIFEYIRTKQLGYNVIVLLEGNKETGSPYIEQFITDYRQELLSDFCLISHSSLLGNTPCIDVGYRGSIHATLKITTANTDMYSGNYGGVVPNAIHEMNKIFSKLYDINNKITIPYFYYDVEDPSFDVLVKNKKIKIDEKKLMTDFAIKHIFKDKEIDLITQIGFKPTIQITGISAGHIDGGYKNSIPNVAYATINFRIVKNQTTKKTIGAFDQWLQTTLPEYVEYEFNISSLYEAIKIDTNNFYFKKAEAVLQKVFDKAVFYKYSGGGLAVVDILERIMNTKSVLVPLVNEDCNVHGTNENFDIDLIEKGFQFAFEFFKK